ncbi:hypothetical protein CYMTET_52147, partial [Cymbomonas tetramitiformis]
MHGTISVLVFCFLSLPECSFCFNGAVGEESLHMRSREDSAPRRVSSSKALLEDDFRRLDLNDDGCITLVEFMSGAPNASSHVYRTQSPTKLPPADFSEPPQPFSEGVRAKWFEQAPEVIKQLEINPSNAEGAATQPETSDQVTSRRRLLESESYVLESYGTERCADTIDAWEDVNGVDCALYKQNEYCTEDGENGGGLDSDHTVEQYGVNGASALDVCCVCGGGIQVIRVGINLDFFFSNGTAVSKNGHHQLAAITMAIEEINANTSLLPEHQLHFALIDSKCDVNIANAASYSLMSWGAEVGLGALCSDASLGAQQAYSYYQIPQISAASSSSALSETEGTFSRTIFSDTFQANAMAGVVAHYNWTRVMTVAVSDSYGTDGIREFHKAAEAYGVYIAEDDRITYTKGAQDFSEVTAAMRRARVLVVVAFGHADEIGRLMEQAHSESTSNYVWVCSSASATSATWEAMSSSLSEAERNAIMLGYIGVVPYIDTSTPEFVAFAERWRQQPATHDDTTGACSAAVDDSGESIWRRYDVDSNLTTYDACIGTNYSANAVDPDAAYAYDAAYTLAYALQERLAGDPDARLESDLVNAIRGQSFTGASGELRFTAAGNREHGLHYTVVNHAGLATLQPVGQWNLELGYQPCTGNASSDCYAIVWPNGGTAPPTGTQYVNVGIMTDLERGGAELGGVVAAFIMAVDSINADNALLPTHELMYVVLDSKCDESAAQVAATQLSEEWLADVVVGAGCSGASIGAQEILIFEQHPQISFASTSSMLTSSSDFFMRTIPSDTFQARPPTLASAGHDPPTLAS